MRAKDHARVYERAAENVFNQMIDPETMSGMTAALAVSYTQFRALAQAYREEAERNPE